MSIGENIKTARKKAGLTQKALAQKTGLATGTIQQYEYGDYKPKIEQLRRIAVALGVYISDLVDDFTIFTQEEIKEDWESGSSGNISHEKATELGGYPQNDSEKPLLDSYRKLNKEGQEKALERVKELTEIPRYLSEEEKETLQNYLDFIKDKTPEHWQQVGELIKKAAAHPIDIAEIAEHQETNPPQD